MKLEKKILDLNDFKIESFVTKLDLSASAFLKGGEPEPYTARPDGYLTEPCCIGQPQTDTICFGCCCMTD